MAGLNALNNRGQWPECLLEAAAQRFRHLRPGKRQAWAGRQADRRHWSTLTDIDRDRDGQTDRQAGRQADRKTGRQTDRQAERRTETGRQTETETAPNNRGQWPECLVEAAAERLRPGKRQAWTPLTTEGGGLSACSKLPRSVLGIWGLANGRLERP